MLKPTLNASVFLHALSCGCQLASLAHSADIKHVFVATTTQLFLGRFWKKQLLPTASRSDGYFSLMSSSSPGSYCCQRWDGAREMGWNLSVRNRFCFRGLEFKELRSKLRHLWCLSVTWRLVPLISSQQALGMRKFVQTLQKLWMFSLS